MGIETTPPQPEEVTQAIADGLADASPEPDPWWQAGLEDTLGE